LSKNKSKSEILIKTFLDLPSNTEGKSKKILLGLSQRAGGGERDRTDDLPAPKAGCSLPSIQPFHLFLNELVEVNGIEPMTSCVQSRCSPN
jgi:hypothetical protein